MYLVPFLQYVKNGSIFREVPADVSEDELQDKASFADKTKIILLQANFDFMRKTSKRRRTSVSEDERDKAVDSILTAMLDNIHGRSQNGGSRFQEKHKQSNLIAKEMIKVLTDKGCMLSRNVAISPIFTRVAGMLLGNAIGSNTYIFIFAPTTKAMQRSS